ncbi:MAG: orotidine 5'-phosphate decarboxylase / HUMPS family protein, partial [Acidobacteriota bacterium]
MKNQKRLILALDGPGPEESVSLLKKLRNVIGICKVGPALFAAGGETLLRRIGDLGFELFLDLKFHDIPETVHREVLEA